MTSGIVRALAVAALVALVAGCASQTGTVVLLPEKDGKDTAVTVKQSDGQVGLREPYAAAKLTTAGPQAYKSNPEEVKALFGAALAAQPGRPVQFTLHFVEGKDELTEESEARRRFGVRGNREAPGARRRRDRAHRLGRQRSKQRHAVAAARRSHPRRA